MSNYYGSANMVQTDQFGNQFVLAPRPLQMPYPGQNPKYDNWYSNATYLQPNVGLTVANASIQTDPQKSTSTSTQTNLTTNISVSKNGGSTGITMEQSENADSVKIENELETGVENVAKLEESAVSDVDVQQVNNEEEWSYLYNPYMSRKAWKCKICPNSWRQDKRRMKRHTEDHKRGNMVQCSKCLNWYATKRSLALHTRCTRLK